MLKDLIRNYEFCVLIVPEGRKRNSVMWDK